MNKRSNQRHTRGRDREAAPLAAATLMIWIIGALLVAFLAISRMPARHRLVLWIMVVAVCVVPWRGLQDHPHWTQIGWIPFISPPITLRDLLINVALYVPFGLFLARRPGTFLGHAVRAAGWALALSLITEATQTYSHGRFSSMTDVAMNVTGAAVGAIGRSVIVRRREHRR